MADCQVVKVEDKGTWTPVVACKGIRDGKDKIEERAEAGTYLVVKVLTKPIVCVVQQVTQCTLKVDAKPKPEAKPEAQAPAEPEPEPEEVEPDGRNADGDPADQE